MVRHAVSERECNCCQDCDHLVEQITQRGTMPDTEDGREVRVLIARKVNNCDNCYGEWGAGLSDGKTI